MPATQNEHSGLELSLLGCLATVLRQSESDSALWGQHWRLSRSTHRSHPAQLLFADTATQNTPRGWPQPRLTALLLLLYESHFSSRYILKRSKIDISQNVKFL